MSSCSSNGFKSFPRRQCCTSTVRFLIEIDHKNKQQQQQQNNKKNYLNFNKTQPAAIPKLSRSKSALSAFQSVVAAVKRLPFAAASSPGNKNLRMFLPRSLSVKILKKSSFWKRKSSHKEIGRWKSFDQLLKEPSDFSISSSAMTSDGNDFTASDECTSGNFPSSEVNMDLPDQVRNDTVELLKNGDVSTDSTSSSDCSNTQWAVSEDKEQFSPVSVLDCPFDDDEEVSSPFQHSLARMEGTHKKLMKNMKRFGSLAQLEPVSLAKQFELQLPNTVNKSSGDEQDQEEGDENQAEQKALNLLNQIDSTSVSSNGLIKMKADKLLLEFLREKIIARDAQHSERRGQCCGGDDGELLEEAENWISERKPLELFLGWEVPRNREAYIKDMERTKEWRLYDGENWYKEVALELEAEVFDVLLNELFIDISS
ncbi:hypothetical protein PHJA_002575300 [Phtheirospermum japonicum]|uniref:DUF4378 domain-containing protein n=1 Tax=Phtheirospermum japonicum TaxID=374723 RepID=A0A830D7S8_9LAMI|nr:hypothetical protein PHJA_002575300 [Phtheirospermum japonicum]